MTDLTQKARELAALINTATHGPWTWEAETHLPGNLCTIYAGRSDMGHGLNLFGRVSPDWNGSNNLNSVCAARNEGPALLIAMADEIDRLRKALTESESVVRLEASQFRDRKDHTAMLTGIADGMAEALKGTSHEPR